MYSKLLVLKRKNEKRERKRRKEKETEWKSGSTHKQTNKITNYYARQKQCRILSLVFRFFKYTFNAANNINIRNIWRTSDLRGTSYIYRSFHNRWLTKSNGILFCMNIKFIVKAKSFSGISFISLLFDAPTEFVVAFRRWESSALER